MAPADFENLDTTTTFYRREGGAWKLLTASSAFPEENLRALGIPQELWPYGDSVRGPAK